MHRLVVVEQDADGQGGSAVGKVAAESAWGAGRPIEGSHKRQKVESHTRRPWVGRPYEEIV